MPISTGFKVGDFELYVLRVRGKADGGVVRVEVPFRLDDYAIFLQIRSYNLGYLTNSSTEDSACAYVTSIGDRSFEFRVYDPGASTHSHPEEDVSIFLARKGRFTVDGKEIEVWGPVELPNNSWQTISYPSGSFPTTPAIFYSYLATGGTYCEYRLNNIGTGNFEALARVYEGSGKIYTYFMAMETGVYSSLKGEVIVTPNKVTEKPYTVNLSGSYSKPDVLAAIQTFDGPDNSWQRIYGIRSTSVDVCVEEMPGKDGPHTDEVIGILVVDNLMHVETESKPASRFPWRWETI